MGQITDLIMPKLGLTMTEGTVSEWLVEPGQSFKKEDVILVIETDKIANEIEAPANGVFEKALVEAGATVSVGTPLAKWDIGEVSKTDTSNIQIDEKTVSAQTPQKENISKPVAGLRVVATPLARRIAKQEGFDLSHAEGSGPNGRIKAADVRRLQTNTTNNLPSDLEDKTSGDTYDRVAATSFELTVARRLTAAKQQIPHFYLATEVEVNSLLELRRQLNAEVLDVRFSVNDLILAAVAQALMNHPDANRVWRDEEILSYHTVSLGMAVNTDQGLFAPILHGLEATSLRDISRASKEMAEKTRQGRLMAKDLTGGVTTVSNAGMFDVTYMTSIINPDHSSILGVGSIRDVFRPDDVGNPVLKKEMGLVLSCDHRIFNGVSGLAFLNCIKSYLEAPLRLLAK